jgi:DNA ligase 1
MLKQYPTLYARTSTGAVQIWFMERDGENYRSTSGQIDGAKTVAAWTQAKPKNVGRANATTAEEQAQEEIDAKYVKQLKSGGYWQNIQDIDNTRFVEPMLAKNFGDFKSKIDWKQGIFVQTKYNGGRILATRHGLFSRKGEQYKSIPHIEEALQPFFKKFPDAVLDGEGFNNDLRESLNEIMKLLRKTVHITPEDLTKSKKLIRFYIYDGYNFPSAKNRNVLVKPTDDYEIRKAAINNAFFAPVFKDRYAGVISFVETWEVFSETELETLYQTFLEDKQEGAILRLRGEYENKRSKNLLKYKPVDDAEFKIVSIQDGDGKFANRAATITCQRLDGKFFTDGTDTFNATFKGTDAQAVGCWRDKTSYIGKIVTIYFNGYTGKGKPNYAQFDINNFDKGN